MVNRESNNYPKIFENPIGTSSFTNKNQLATNAVNLLTVKTKFCQFFAKIFTKIINCLKFSRFKHSTTAKLDQS